MKNRISVLIATTVLAFPMMQRTLAETEEGGVWVGPANLSPTLTIGVFYESNPDEVSDSRRKIMRQTFIERYGKDRDESAVGFNVTPGILLHVPGNQWSLKGSVHFTYEKDDSDFSRDPRDWDQSLLLQGTTDGGLGWRLGQTWQRLNYSRFDDFSQDDREALSFLFGLDKELTDKSGATLSGSYRNLDYKDRELYDRDYYNLRLGGRHQLTDKSNLMLSLGYSESQGDYRRRYDSEGNPYRGSRSKSRSYSAQAGVGSRATEKISYTAMLGLALLKTDYSADPFTGEQPRNKDKYRLSYLLSGNWKASERLTFNLNGNTSYESSEDVLDNSLMAYTITGRADYRLYRRIRLSAGVSYRYEEFLRRVAVYENVNGNPYVGTDEGRGRSRNDDQVNIFGDITYGINRYASAFLNAIYSETSSSIKEFDYDRYRISAGVALQY